VEPVEPVSPVASLVPVVVPLAPVSLSLVLVVASVLVPVSLSPVSVSVYSPRSPLSSQPANAVAARVERSKEVVVRNIMTVVSRVRPDP
jgi:hypothetical protein